MKWFSSSSRTLVATQEMLVCILKVSFSFAAKCMVPCEQHGNRGRTKYCFNLKDGQRRVITAFTVFCLWSHIQGGTAKDDYIIHCTSNRCNFLLLSNIERLYIIFFVIIVLGGRKWSNSLHWQHQESLSSLPKRKLRTEAVKNHLVYLHMKGKIAFVLI